MSAEWLLRRCAEFGDHPAVIWRDQPHSYRRLLERVHAWSAELEQRRVASGTVAAIVSDYSVDACALLLALLARQAVIVPLTSSVRTQHRRFMDIAEAQVVFSAADDQGWAVERLDRPVRHALTQALVARGAPGLVLFSSGSTGESKASLHDFGKLLAKFQQRRTALRTIVFLLFDHIGGINTLLHTLSSGGSLVVVENRSPEAVCQAIERHRAEVLPTSPTFLNLLLLSGEHERHDLSSLKLVTYGTEVMPESTLARLNHAFPGVSFKQTYGLSELGILRSKSRDSSSLWMKVGGEGYETKIVDGTLWIRADSAMLGYLNAPSPFDPEGWFNTSDRVMVDGEFIRILGRDSDIINVGGEKVYPAEVEGVVMEVDNIADACVYGEPDALMGHRVVAEVTLRQPESPLEVRRRVRRYCGTKLARYKIPVEVRIAAEGRTSPRFKKMRPLAG